MNKIMVVLLVLSALILVKECVAAYQYSKRRKLVQRRIDSAAVIHKFVELAHPERMSYAICAEDNEIYVQFWQKPTQKYNIDKILREAN